MIKAFDLYSFIAVKRFEMSTRFAFAGVPLALFLLLFALPSVQAADIALSSQCSLADAIIAANTDRTEGGCPAGRGADTITLRQDITLRAELPAITSDITIKGNGYIISGGDRYRIFYNDGGTLTIHNLTMTKGRAEGEIISNADGMLKNSTANPIGGAVVNWSGTLAISDSSFSGNSADERGGAIANGGELSISNSSFSGNSADECGGAIFNWEYGELSISSSTFSDNSAEYECGGAIFNWEYGELSISNSSFSDNSADLSGGAIDNLGELSISESSFSGNSAEYYSGAIYNWEYGELSISSSTFSGNSAGVSGGAIQNFGELSIRDNTFSDNSAGESGGAIDNFGELSIRDSTFSDNSAEWNGGAIYNFGELSISDSTFSNNSAESDGGAIYNAGELSISNSSFSDNSAERDGGAIANWVDGELSITNSTFSDNSAERDGGAISNSAGGDGATVRRLEGKLNIINSTFSDNSADIGGAIANAGELSMTNSIIAGRGGFACYSDSRLKRNINNFIQNGTCSPAFRGDPKLGELVVPEDGSPAYFPLLAGSRAIDAANDAYCPETDQIGTPRPQGAGCDIGAVERE